VPETVGLGFGEDVPLAPTEGPGCARLGAGSVSPLIAGTVFEPGVVDLAGGVAGFWAGPAGAVFTCSV
jgi:hypothetical protein